MDGVTAAPQRAKALRHATTHVARDGGWRYTGEVRLPLCALVALATALAGPAEAARPAASPTKKPKGPAYVVLVRATDDVPSTWSPELRRAVYANVTHRFVDPPAVGLNDAASVAGCAGWSVACAVQIGALVDADAVIVVDVDKGSVTVEVAGAATLLAARSVLPDLGADGLAVAKRFVGGAVAGATPSLVRFSADLDPTRVVIDGAVVGDTPITVDTLAVGEHRVVWQREGRAPLSRTIVVKPGFQREHAALAASGPPLASAPTVGVVSAPPAPPPPVEAAAGGEGGGVGLLGIGTAAAGGVVTVVGAVVAVVGRVQASALRRDLLSADLIDRGCLRGSGENLVGVPVGDGCAAGSAVFFSDEDGDPTPDATRADANQQAAGYGIATTGLVIAVAGVVVAATGVALALGDGEDADAAAR